MNMPLLTIGIPTYNRAELLDHCLKTLSPLLRRFGSQVQLLISDNCSTDDTPQVIDRFLSKNQFETETLLHTHDKNIGLVPNIVSLFDSARTPFLIFMGDDDELIASGLANLLENLERRPAPSGVVQGEWTWTAPAPDGQLSHQGFFRYFYEFGNAWAGVYHVPTCREILQDSELRGRIEDSYWGQISLGMLSVEQQTENKPAFVYRAWGKVAQERPYDYNHSWLVFSLANILDAISTWRSYSREKHTPPKKSLISYHVFRAHFIGIILQRYTNTGEAKMRFSDLRKNLRENFGFAGVVYYVLLWVGCTRVVNKLISLLRAMILKIAILPRKSQILS
jgi:glycosyltransferase involved in cell wall biosynthesis